MNKLENTLKTFKDLKFEQHKLGNGKQAVLLFPNGYGVSVVRHKCPISKRYSSYTSNDNQWELAILKGDDAEWSLCYDTGITDDVLGYLSDEDVSKVMKEVQMIKD